MRPIASLLALAFWHLGRPRTRIVSAGTLTPPTHSFWKGKSSESDLAAALRAVDAEAWSAQKDAGISLVALDGTAYDQVLDAITALGLAPRRFQVSRHRALGLHAQRWGGNWSLQPIRSGQTVAPWRNPF